MKRFFVFISVMFLFSALMSTENFPRTLNEVDFSNTPNKFAGKVYTATFTFNIMESSVKRIHTLLPQHYGGLLVREINGEHWDSTYVYFNRTDSEVIKGINAILKNQSDSMEYARFTLKVKYLGKFGELGGGKHSFEMIEMIAQ